MTKLSVIIPCFNGEKELGDTLNCLINTGYEDMEIIVVNDASTDRTPQIVEEFSEQYPIVRLINNEKNSGLSATRNNGIRHANGEYIQFMDHDDSIEKNIFKTVFNKISTDTDILVYGVHVDFAEEGYSLKETSPEGLYIAEHKLEGFQILFEHDLFNYAWNKVYRKELIKDILFNDDRFYQGEDFGFNCEAFTTANTLQIISDPLYHYIKRNKDTMVTKYVKDYGKIIDNKKEALKSMYNSVSETLPNSYYDYMLREYEVFMVNLFKDKCDLTDKQKKTYIKEFMLTDEVKEIIAKGTPSTSYSKLFKAIYSTHSIEVLFTSYKTLTWLKNSLGSTYLKIRKQLYQS